MELFMFLFLIFILIPLLIGFIFIIKSISLIGYPAFICIAIGVYVACKHKELKNWMKSRKNK